MECDFFFSLKGEDWNGSGNVFKKCVLLANKHWEQKNPTNKMMIVITNEAWGNSWITNYLAITFIEEKLKCYPNELYFPLWFWSPTVLKNVSYVKQHRTEKYFIYLKPKQKKRSEN